MPALTHSYTQAWENSSIKARFFAINSKKREREKHINYSLRVCCDYFYGNGGAWWNLREKQKQQRRRRFHYKWQWWATPFQNVIPLLRGLISHTKIFCHTSARQSIIFQLFSFSFLLQFKCWVDDWRCIFVDMYVCVCKKEMEKLFLFNERKFSSLLMQKFSI